MKYIVAFVASEFVNFRQAEFSALVRLQGLELEKIVSDLSTDNWLRPYLVINLDSDAQAEALIERSVLIKAVYHHWCDASSFPDLLSEVCYCVLFIECMLQVARIPTNVADQYLNSACTYKVVISSANKKIDHQTKLTMIEDVLNAHPTLDATVCLSDPQVRCAV